MRVSIHQPSYLPWIPFMEKALQSDIFVLLDNVQFEKNSEQNRNRIKTAQGETWLTVPVQRKLHTLIPDVVIPDAQPAWQTKHRRAIEMNYSKAPHFEQVSTPLFALLNRKWTRLLDLNLAVDALFFEFVGLQTRVVRASTLPVSGEKSDRILSLCTAVGAHTYLSGPAGADYLNLPRFVERGIEVVFQNYRHPEYPQQVPAIGFLPRLSALDLFMNVGIGEKARRFILREGRWEELHAL